MSKTKLKEITNKEKLLEINSEKMSEVIMSVLFSISQAFIDKHRKVNDANFVSFVIVSPKIKKWLDAKYYGWCENDDINRERLEEGFKWG